MLIYNNLIQFNKQIFVIKSPYIFIKKKYEKKANVNSFKKVFIHRNLIHTNINKIKKRKFNDFPNLNYSYKYKGVQKRRILIKKKQSKKVLNEVLNCFKKKKYNVKKK
jgi:hypothetical protein